MKTEPGRNIVAESKIYLDPLQCLPLHQRYEQSKQEKSTSYRLKTLSGAKFVKKYLTAMPTCTDIFGDNTRKSKYTYLSAKTVLLSSRIVPLTTATDVSNTHPHHQTWDVTGYQRISKKESQEQQRVAKFATHNFQEKTIYTDTCEKLIPRNQREQ